MDSWTIDTAASSATDVSPDALPPSEPQAFGGFDSRLIQQSKNEIRGLVHEITRLSQADLDEPGFFAEFLPRVVAALAASGGAIWRRSDEGGGNWRLEQEINLAATGLEPIGKNLTPGLFPRSAGAREDFFDKVVDSAAAVHARLLERTAENGQPVAVPPCDPQRPPTEIGNPTTQLLLLATISSDAGVHAILEIFQRPGGGPVTQRGYLRFLAQMAELAADFLRRRQFRELTARQQWSAEFEVFVRAIHTSLDPQRTAFAIVNEARRLLGVDRISLTLGDARQSVIAVSGIDTLDPRSEQIARLSRLVHAVAAIGDPLWHPAEAASAEMPPQIAEPLDAYVDHSHARALGLLPLRTPAGSLLGVLVIEQFSQAEFSAESRRRAVSLADFAAVALANVREYRRASRRWLPGRVADALVKSTATTRRKIAAAAASAAAVVLALVFVPAELKIAADGQLMPERRQHVFAEIDGTVESVAVTHDQEVAAGQMLARLRNPDLDLAVTQLLGRQATNDQQRRALQRSLLNQPELPTEVRNRFAGELAELQAAAESLDRQRQLFARKTEQLEIRSPCAGRVVSWQVAERLKNRPVAVGEKLMTIVDPAGPWELDLQVAARDVRHLSPDEVAAGRQPTVTFALVTHPGRTFSGRVVEIEPAVMTRDEGSAADPSGEDARKPDGAVRLRVAVDRSDLPELRPEVAVSAWVHCGSRSLGYVWLRDLIDTVQTEILFRL